ncbi:MAG: hypothetical protein Q7U47_08510, partial [Paludibacter sp.]|nr:hypothetical protein [Paludibacter sp.]
MSIPQIFPNHIITYYPAALHVGGVWYVNYYILNPFTDVIVEKRIKINRIKSIPERRIFARNLIRELNIKLQTGWNPFITPEGTKEFHLLTEVIETYKRAKFKELEKNSVRSYESFLLKLNLHITKIDKNMYCGSFTKRQASDFMLLIKSDNHVSHRTYNNHLLFYRRFFKWIQDFDYIAANPFETIPTISKKLIHKKRRALDRSQLRELVVQLESTHPRFLAACMMLYYCLLRPDDLMELKRKHFDLIKNVIIIFEAETKNKNSSLRTIPIALEKYLRYLDIEKLHPDDYVFSDRYNLAPGRIKILNSSVKLNF